MNKVFEEILERLNEKIMITWNHDYEGGRKDAFNEAKQIVQEVAEEYTSTEHSNCSTDTSTNGWIACSSGNMPNNRQKVFVEFNDGMHMCLVYRTKDSRDKSNGWEGNITQDGFYEICSDCGWRPYINIIAWQPLPKPFKECD